MSIQQARYLEQLVRNNPQLELLAPVPLNIVCFRFVAETDDLNSINQEILIQLHETGTVAPSSTYINGNYAIRVAITNHRSTFNDFNTLVEKTIQIGNSLLP